jgi:N-acetylglucosamine-6-phosphate deacetylase
MLLKNGNVLNSRFEFVKTDITVENGKFVSLLPKDSEEGIDLSNKYIVPGLIDIHIHGANGYQVMDESEQSMSEMASFLLKNGTTTFCPTLPTLPYHAMYSALDNIRKYRMGNKNGAKVGGIHLEGPFVSKTFKGALDENAIREPNIRVFNEMNAFSDYNIKIISLAPELPGAMKFIQEISPECVVSIAHTDSDYNTAVEAISNGASHMTHTFNAMRPFKHREPNALGAAFDSNITCECISDGIHLHPSTVRTLYKIVGADRLVLISDGCIQVGLADGEYTFGERKLLIKDGKATLPDGTIDGGCFTLLQNVRSAIQFGIPAEAAFRCASLNPAKVLKMDHVVGSIDVGKCADFLVLDQEYELCAVCKDGILLTIKEY